MKVGPDYFSYGGATFRYAWFYYYPGSTSVYCNENGRWYSLKSFLRKK